MICYTNSSADATSFTNDQIIEGYLAWKWGIQTSLPSNHPHRNAAPPGFVPTSVPNCAVWLDSADGATIVTDVFWGNKTSLTTASRNSTGFPTYVSNVVNNRNAVLCSDGTQGIQLNTANNAALSLIHI